MKNFKLFLLLLAALLLSFSAGYSQLMVKLGPSVQVNYLDFDEIVLPVFGAELGLELPIQNHFSASLAATAHYGTVESTFDPETNRKDFLIGAQIDGRYHFKEVFDGPYLALGFNFGQLTARNYFEPMPNDPVPTLQDWEYNVVLGAGYQFQTAGGTMLTPFLNIGVTPDGYNEYTANARFGLMVSLN